MQLPKIRYKDFEIRKTDQQEMQIGLALIGLSFLMPVLFTVQSFRVQEYMYRALENMEKTDIMVAALRLVMLNALRAVPHYVGAYFIAESLQFYWRGKKSWIPNSCIILMILPLVYEGIDIVPHIRYDFGLPALLLSLCVALFRRLDYQYISRTKKTLMLIIFTIAFQFLDIMPLMRSLPVGRGESSIDIKLIADVLDADSLLNAVGAVGILVVTLFAVIILFQLRDENNIRRLAQEREKMQVMQSRAALLEMKNRTFQEMKYLVHDLKSPLTSTQTLVGILKMQNEAPDRERELEYLTRIENQMDRMGTMISEILYENKCSPSDTKRLLNMALAQLSVESYASCIHIENLVPERSVSVNSILFTRVLVNLIHNAAQAASPDRPLEIWLRVRDRLVDGVPFITFSVSDNGCGMTAQQQTTMWEQGVSGRGSSGMGLAFVKQTVESMDGSVVAESRLGKGTRFIIFLPEVLDHGTQNHDSFH